MISKLQRLFAGGRSARETQGVPVSEVRILDTQKPSLTAELVAAGRHMATQGSNPALRLNDPYAWRFMGLKSRILYGWLS